MAFKAIPVVAAKVPSTQTNFPAYIKPSALTGWGSITLAEAQSSRWYSDEAKTVELAREIVSADEIHVKVTSLTTTTTLYVDYDGIRADYAVTDTYGRNAVWSDYAAVYHLNTNSNDSTANGLNGTDTAITYGSGNGQISAGADFNGSTSVINLGTSATLNFATTSYTVSAWSQPQSSAALMGVVNKRDGTAPNAGHAIGYDWISADKYSFIQRNTSTTNFELSSTETTPLNSWYHTVSVYDAGAGSSIIYVGAVSNTLSTPSRGNIGNSKSTYIGALQEASFKWNGYIDEVRLRASVLSQNWITTEYNNQNDVATFWGTVTDVGGAPVANNGFMLWL